MSKPRPKWQMQFFPSDATDSTIRRLTKDSAPDGKYATSICKQCGRFTCCWGVAGEIIVAEVVRSCSICRGMLEYEEKNKRQVAGQ